ncbi:TetR/AcrR family transcriptional regulator [Trueperella pyogenes]|uniref:TetR/AcrR family transcriptional regulator n=1 Tax=Trueperella pyogenes TaxID=1661 RepID=UPI002168CB4A|nr:TetR/AcrR family transcriptional regulator [Trueperella pyogenes]UVJ55604.1 TetR/AcrR family transcriptional regulator [Trueperella pyogenes]WHU58332.1 TetR/AcrR family transcriptional regulator [Trueperella pyogenes]
MQVLKEEVRERILTAAIQVFYEKDFRSARMQDIANLAGVSASLLYSYFKNKEKLFEDVASSHLFDFDQIARKEESIRTGTPFDRYKLAAEEPLLDMLAHHKLLVILIDKSQGTAYEHTKADFIESIERHIRHMTNRGTSSQYPDLLAHVLASNFVESLMEVARHYSNEDEARNMLALLAQCYYEGVNSL